MIVPQTSAFAILQGNSATPPMLLEVVLTSASLQYPVIMQREMVRNKSPGLGSAHQLLEVVAVLLLEPQPHWIVVQVAVNIKLTTPTQ